MQHKYVIPERWIWTTHDDVAAINPKLPKNGLDDDLEVSFVPMTSVQEETGAYNLQFTRKYKAVKKGYTCFVDGDLLFAKITPCMENGKIAVVDNLVNGIGYGSTEFHVSRPDNGIERKYLFFFFVQSSFRKDARKNMTGSAGQLRVPANYFKQVSIPLAPLPEQRAIVAKIEQLFSELDNGISNLKNAQEQLRVYRQAVLKQAFEGELTRAWRQQQAKLPSAHELLDRITREREAAAKAQGKKLKPVKPITEEELAELPVLPDGWAWVRLAEFSEIVGGVTKGRNLTGKRTVSLPYLRVANVQDGYLDLKEIKSIDVLDSDLVKYRLESGDILYTEGGDKDKLGRGTIWRSQIKDCIHQNHIFRARLRSQIMASEYIAYYSQSRIAKDYFYKKAKQTVNLASINLTILSELYFPICANSEQLKIVQEIESRFSVCDNLESAVKESLQKAEALRQSILQKAFEGSLLSDVELDETRRAADWEPAEQLLERIKVARANHKDRR